MRRALALAALIATLAACATEPRTTYPPAGVSPGPAAGRTDATVAKVIAALGAVGLPAQEAAMTYRPPEGALLTAAPRTIVQATLPDDPTRGFVVIYALASPEAAAAAAADQVQLIAKNRGGQFPFSARFVLRTVDSNVVFFMWVPETSPDARTPLIEQALLTVGTEVPITR